MRRVTFGHIASLQFFGTQRIGIVGVELSGLSRAIHRLLELLAQKEGFFNTEQERAQHGKNGVKAERNTFEKEEQTVGFRSQKADACDKDKCLNIAGPGVESEL